MPIIIPGSQSIYRGLSSPFQSVPSNWETFYTGGSLALTAAVFGAFLWLDITGCLVQSRCRAVAALAVPVGANWLWYIGASYLVFYGVVGTGVYGPFSAVASFLQLLAVFGWSVLHRRSLRLVSFTPVKFAVLFGTLGMVFIALFLFVLTGMFNRADDGVRILIRLVVVPILGELLSAGIRLGGREMLDGNVPGVSRGFMLAPVSLVMAFIGRFFTTGMNSLGLTIGLSIAVAALEMTMRWTMLQRDSLFIGCLNRVWKWSGKVVPCCARAKTQRSLPKTDTIASIAPSDHRVHWRDLPASVQRAREQRANYAFIIGDTVAEDIGMLTLIPVAIFFRLPTRIGGQPLPVGDVLLRVGFQWLLELWTDVGPFVLYAAGRAWLSWRGDTLYRGVTRGEVRAALSSLGHSTGGTPGAQALFVDKHLTSDVSSLPVKNAPVVAVDDSIPAPPQCTGSLTEAAWSNPLQAETLRADDSFGLSTIPGSPGAEECSGLGSPQARGKNAPPHAGNHGSTAAAAGDDAALRCVQASRRVKLDDDADVLWQRLPWTTVRRAMAPSAVDGDWGWLHWFVYRNELLVARVSAAWTRRQQGWSLGMLVLVFVLCTTVVRGYFNARTRCPVPDRDGDWFWDACT